MNAVTEKKQRRPRTPVTVIVAHEFIGDKTLAEAFIPVIFEDLRQKADKHRTIDNQLDST